MYRHTQVGTTIIVVMGIVLASFAALILFTPTPPLVLAPSGIIIALCLVLFASLTVQVDEEAVEARFGPGLVRFRFPLAEIESVATITTPWWYGRGIHWVGDGWLYNVAGPGAVELTLRGGGRPRIGSDEPERLAQAIREQISLATGTQINR